MEQQSHTFQGGMNKDLSLYRLQENQYTDANNLRVTTQDGSTSVSLVNVDGNELSFTLPDVNPSKQLIPTGLGATTIDIGAVTITVSAAGNLRTYLKQIADDINTHVSLPNIKASVIKDNSGIIIYHEQGDIITVTSGAFTVTDYTALQADLIPIGYCVIRESLILFTTNDTTDAGGMGQVWEITFDKDSKAHQRTRLVYNNDIKFTTKHPIRSLGLFENNFVKHVYFIDNNDVPKTLNIATFNAFAILPEMTGVSTPSKGSVPLLEEVTTGGTLEAGAYHIFYILRNKYGTQTSSSVISNQINIVDTPEFTDDYQDYEGTTPGTITGKSIKFSIANLDLNYDTIEFGYVYYSSSTSTPIIRIFREDKTTSADMVGTLTGSETERAISFDQFLNPQTVFETVKELVAKDNTLFFMNTTTKNFDIDFDARAYRFKSGQTSTNIYDAAGNATAVTAANWDTVDEEHDAINKYNNEDDASWEASHQYKYKLNSTILGGSGPNVSYEFTMKGLSGDIESVQGNLGPDIWDTSPTRRPFIEPYEQAAATIDFGVPGQIYNIPEHTPGNLRGVYFSNLYAGYARGEVYRFGIVFYKNGQPSFTKWIGDVKFPFMNDIDGQTTLANPDLTHFPIGREPLDTALNSVELASLGIKFTVDISSIKSDIDGFSIVRVERKPEDKTRLGTGILNTVGTDATITDGIWYSKTTSGNSNETKKHFNFDGPDVHFNTINYKPGDYIRILEELNDVIYSQDFIKDPEDSSSSIDIWYKYRSGNHITTNVKHEVDFYKAVDNYGIVPQGDISLSGPFWNMGRTASGADLEFPCAGSRTSFIELLVDLDFNTYNIDFYQVVGVHRDPGKLLVSYERYNTGQYGGDTYSDRSRNEYLLCNNFVKIDSSSANSQIFKVYGGDTYVNYYDHTKLEKNWGDNHTGLEAPTDGSKRIRDLHAQMYYTENSFNVDLRTGFHFASKGTSSEYPNNGTRLHDTYTYNTVYSKPNDLRTFIPKPFDFESDEKQDHRIWASEIKTSGEHIDSWTIFRPADFRDLESQYGEINAATVFNDRLIIFQNNGTGTLAIYPVSLVQDSNQQSLTLGTGDKMQKHTYIDNTVGTIHQWSVINTGSNVYFYDANHKTIYVLNGEGSLQPLSITKGMSSHLHNNISTTINKNDNPIEYKGISVGYDTKHKEVLFTFFYEDNSKETLVYSELTQAFVGFYDFQSSIYINTLDKLISVNPSTKNELYLHNKGDLCEFYSTYFDSDLTLVCNKFPEHVKTFDNHVVNATTKTPAGADLATSFDSYIAYNSFQQTTTLVLDADTLKRRERDWRMYVPRDINTPVYTSFKPRMRDKYLKFKFTFTNAATVRKLILDSIRTIFRKSHS